MLRSRMRHHRPCGYSPWGDDGKRKKLGNRDWGVTKPGPPWGVLQATSLPRYLSPD